MTLVVDFILFSILHVYTFQRCPDRDITVLSFCKKSGALSTVARVQNNEFSFAPKHPKQTNSSKNSTRSSLLFTQLKFEYHTYKATYLLTLHLRRGCELHTKISSVCLGSLSMAWACKAPPT